MTAHLPFNEFDMAGITNAVSRYKSAGLRADYSIDKKGCRRIVLIALENPVTRDGSIAIFEIHKVTRPSFSGRKAWWVVQMFSRDSDTEATKQHGCVAAATQAAVLTSAEVNLKHGFLSIANFDMAAEGY